MKRGLACKCRRLAGLPVMKLSTQTTSCPSARNRSHRCEPMKPAPPVIRVRMRSSRFSCLTLPWRHPGARRMTEYSDHCNNCETDCRSARAKYATSKDYSFFGHKVEANGDPTLTNFYGPAQSPPRTARIARTGL